MEELKEAERYINRETKEVLINPLDISYYKNLQLDQIEDNFLLGEFDEVGAYIIKKEILLELVTVKKIIKESSDNKFLIYSKLKRNDFPDLKFTLKIEDGDDNTKVATLKFIESITKIDGEKEILKTVVARYKDDNDIYFMIKVKKVFSIDDETSDPGQELSDEEFMKLTLRKWQDFSLVREKKDEFAALARKYIEKVLSILKDNDGMFSEYVIRAYSKVLFEKKGHTKPLDYKELKIQLDRIIDESRKRVKEEKVVPLIMEARKEYLEDYGKVKEKTVVLEPALAKKEVSVDKAKPFKSESEKPTSKPKNNSKDSKKSKKVEEKKDLKDKDKKSAEPFKLISPIGSSVKTPEVPIAQAAQSAGFIDLVMKKVISTQKNILKTNTLDKSAVNTFTQ